jgi:hypothetical protein
MIDVTEAGKASAVLRSLNALRPPHVALPRRIPLCIQKCTQIADEGDAAVQRLCCQI